MTPAYAMPAPLPRLGLEWPQGAEFAEAASHEWLVTNGRGGYASGTVAGCNTRRYHGLLVPNLEQRGRTVLLARLAEHATVQGHTYRLDAEERADGSREDGALAWLRRFHLEGLVPRWEWTLGPARLRRTLVLVHGEDTAFLLWEHLEGPELRLRLRPYLVERMHDLPLQHQPAEPVVRVCGARMELQAHAQGTPLRLRVHSASPAPFVALSEVSAPQLLHTERSRGYDHVESQASPGYFDCTLPPGGLLALGVTLGDHSLVERDPHQALELELERERRLLSRAPESARSGVAARLVLAADQFIVDPARSADDAWARAMGQDARSIIAGYHWFTDWGRDTMISLEGLTLCTGRHREAAAILRTFQHHVRQGLLPNLFPEGGSEGLYHTADATLWLFHALDRYLVHTGDRELLRDLYPTLTSIVAHHLQGTRFNIRVDPADGLLTQGEEGYALTWMDAKVDGWVVTPRRGKAVELSALWFNAMRLMAEWAEALGADHSHYLAMAERTQVSFNHRFWNAQAGCLYDIVDGESGEDAAVRPNQVLAISLKHPVLRRDRWEPVLARVRAELLTPVGLRSLAPGHPEYKPRYDGDLRARDAAYHQGTVWGWLMGHYVDATLKLDSDEGAARALLEGLKQHLQHAGLGQISEIFDATEPFRPRGCIAQAWSVAEALRIFLRTGVR